MKKQSMSRQGGAKTRNSNVYLRVQVDMPICMWGVSKCTHIREELVKMSKLINTNTTTVFNVRDDKNAPIPNYFVVKNNETKEYFVSDVLVGDVSELTSKNTVSPMTKNYADAQDMVKVLGADVTLNHITPEGLTKIRSERGKKAWAKKQELAKATS
tara:strand:- start:2337 stop:2807 length:471 start_codon:yes stop_codon:yes gene_type:complete